MSYKSGQWARRVRGRKALEGKRGLRRERCGGAKRIQTPVPTLVTAGNCGSPKLRRGQGRHVILDLVHSSSSGKWNTKDWPLPPLAGDGVQPEWPAPLRESVEDAKNVTLISPTRVSLTGGLSFSENAQTDLAAHSGAFAWYFLETTQPKVHYTTRSLLWDCTECKATSDL